MLTIREILNKLKWHLNLSDYFIKIIHRGSPNNVKVIPGSKVTSIKSSYFIYVEDGKEVLIPFHRILEITSKNGEKLYSKHSRK